MDQALGSGNMPLFGDPVLFNLIYAVNFTFPMGVLQETSVVGMWVCIYLVNDTLITFSLSQPSKFGVFGSLWNYRIIMWADRDGG